MSMIAELFAQMRQAPVSLMVRLQGALVIGAVLVAVTVSAMVSERTYQRAPFAVPAQTTRGPWRDEVDAFAGRLERVFRVQSRVADEFAGWILEASKRQHLRPELLASVVFTESSFRTNVVSSAGAIGPAQVQPFWQQFCGATSLDDPAENIYCGAQILAYLQDVCGGEQCALSAYNVGLRGHRESEEFQQAGRRYVRKVQRHLDNLQRHTI